MKKNPKQIKRTKLQIAKAPGMPNCSLEFLGAVVVIDSKSIREGVPTIMFLSGT